MVPSLLDSDTFCVDGYEPDATLARGALGAVVSLLSRPFAVPPLPKVASVGAMVIGPSARPASDAAGTVEDQAVPPSADAVTILPAESVSVIPVRLAPGWATPLTVRSLPALA